MFFSSIFAALVPQAAWMWARLAALGVVAAQERLWAALVACVFARPRSGPDVVGRRAGSGR